MASSLEELLPRLIESTEDGSLPWAVSEGPPKPRYHVIIGNQLIIEVWSWTDQDSGTSGYTITLKRNQFENEPIDMVSSDQYSPHSATLARLFKAARRAAHDVRAAIKQIEEYLDIPF